MKTADFDFELPENLIATRPSEKRDSSRLMVLHKDGSVEHKRFFQIIDYLKAGDMLLMNNTKVFPARIIGKKPGGQAVDMLLVRETSDRAVWEILCRGNADGPVTIFNNSVRGQVYTLDIPVKSIDLTPKKRYLRLPESTVPELNGLLWKYGYMPLPPYIRRMPEDADKERYQTIYAERQGSIAAPTAGLHFTDELIRTIQGKGVLVRFLTLHVGTGTFRPVRAEALKDHHMEEEYFEVERSVLQEAQQVKQRGGRLIAVGTTTTRAVESVWEKIGTATIFPLEKWSLSLFSPSIKGTTDIFIYPGYRFRVVDSLLTNFHLPRSTPLMLAAALSDFGKITKAYKEAVAGDYRFFSYGDAMLIL